ncbi:MAG: hypothetical protein ACOYMB_04735 [Patescibacteria group bacterium]
MGLLNWPKNESAKNITELDPDFVGHEKEITEIKKDVIEKRFENSGEKIEKIELGATIIMSDLFGGIPTKLLAYSVGALKTLFPDKDNRWLIEKANSL